MRLFFVFILFMTTNYALQTYFDSYKYHETGLLLEFLPLFLLTVLCSFLYKKTLYTQKFIWTYLKLAGTSIAGYLTAEAILFYQWYWFINPEYRNIPGDMAEGLGFTIFDSIIRSIAITLSYLIILLKLKSLNRQKANSNLT